ncbi:hypothetical protein [Acinetobacter lwoffii]|uniref:hypothetical protein n=1 Tax=Acinetobacter lwoffii TaxID=28090 RepID=UPI0035BC822C|nr:hypothetical protein ABEDC_2498 [Acinetobacter lwoffii]
MSVEERSESIDSLQLDILIQCFERALKTASFRWGQDPELDYNFSSWVKPWVINFGTTFRGWYWLLNLPDRKYCHRIQIFSDCIHARFAEYSEEERIKVIKCHAYSDLPTILMELAFALNSSQYKRRCHDNTYQVKDRKAELKKKIEDVLSQHCRILPYRFELYYREKFVNEISSVEFYQQLKEFTQVIHDTTNFDQPGKQDVEILFFARVAEQGVREGHFHVHFLVILDGKHHPNVHRFRTGAEELWVRITEGKGYLSDYQGATSYGRQNISNRVIHNTDSVLLGSLFESAYYLAKIGTESNQHQYLRIRPKGMDAFACSHHRK